MAPPENHRLLQDLPVMGNSLVNLEATCFVCFIVVYAGHVWLFYLCILENKLKKV